MTPFQRISGHVMALFYKYNATRFDLKKPEDATLMDRWKVALSHSTTDLDLIDKCFEPLYEKKSMPNPKDFQEVLAIKRRIGPERQVTMQDISAAANTPWRKALMNFLTTKDQFTGGSRAYFTRLAQLAKEHNRMEFHEEVITLTPTPEEAI